MTHLRATFWSLLVLGIMLTSCGPKPGVEHLDALQRTLVDLDSAEAAYRQAPLESATPAFAKADSALMAIESQMVGLIVNLEQGKPFSALDERRRMLRRQPGRQRRIEQELDRTRRQIGRLIEATHKLSHIHTRTSRALLRTIFQLRHNSGNGGGGDGGGGDAGGGGGGDAGGGGGGGNDGVTVRLLWLALEEAGFVESAATSLLTHAGSAQDQQARVTCLEVCVRVCVRARVCVGV